MKTASTTLINYLNSVRGMIDAPLAFADCYAFTLATGTALTWTNADYPVTFDGVTYSDTGPLVMGLKSKQSVGLEVDKQQLTIAARPTDLIAGAPVLESIRGGAFDGATILRYRVFLTAAGGTVIDGVLLFQGRVSTVDSVGRTAAQITVASDLIILGYDMPKNFWAPTCQHVLYDSGCGVIRGTYAASSTAGAGSTATLINSSAALAAHQGGSLVFTSGANANERATVKSVVVGTSLTLMYPLPETPATGDAFIVYAGCDHTMGTCQNQFNNLANFRGFPFVPLAVVAA